MHDFFIEKNNEFLDLYAELKKMNPTNKTIHKILYSSLSRLNEIWINDWVTNMKRYENESIVYVCSTLVDVIFGWKVNSNVIFGRGEIPVQAEVEDIHNKRGNTNEARVFLFS